MSQEDDRKILDSLEKPPFKSKKFIMILIGLFLMTGTGVGVSFMFPANVNSIFETYVFGLSSIILGYVGAAGASEAVVKRKFAERNSMRETSLKNTSSDKFPREPLMGEMPNIPIETGVFSIVGKKSPPPLIGNEG